MKKSIIFLAAVILALALPSVAFANEPVEVDAGAENATTGDKVDITVSGPNFDELEGMVKLNCKFEDGDTEEIIMITSSEIDDCFIDLLNNGDTVIVIDICASPPTITVTDAIGDADCPQIFMSGFKELDLTIKVL